MVLFVLAIVRASRIHGRECAMREIVWRRAPSPAQAAAARGCGAIEDFDLLAHGLDRNGDRLGGHGARVSVGLLDHVEAILEVVCVHGERRDVEGRPRVAAPRD